MRIPTDAKERELLLHKLRHAVVFQIGAWDAASIIAEAIDSELDIVLEYVTGAAVIADDGMDLGYADLDDLVGVGPQRIVVGKPLRESPRPIN